MTPRCLPLADAARYCGVSPAIMRKYGPTYIKIGAARVYDVQSLDKWIDSLLGIEHGAAANDAERQMLEALQ